MDLHDAQLITVARDGQLVVHRFNWNEDPSDATVGYV